MREFPAERRSVTSHYPSGFPPTRLLYGRSPTHSHHQSPETTSLPGTRTHLERSRDRLVTLIPPRTLGKDRQLVDQVPTQLVHPFLSRRRFSISKRFLTLRATGDKVGRQDGLAAGSGGNGFPGCLGGGDVLQQGVSGRAAGQVPGRT